MLHLLGHPAIDDAPLPYAEAVSRLASVRHALRLVEPFAGGPASALSADGAIAAAWPNVGEARQRCFDKRSARLVGTAAQGLEALLITRDEGVEPNREASQTLVDEIRRELREVAHIVLS